MQRFARTHLSDPLLLSSAADHAGRERAAAADLLADLAEIDARKLYLPAGYSSMFAFCVGDLRLSEDAACKRITVARAARRFPAIFPAVAEGRLHLSGVVLLAPHLVEETAEGLLAAAAHKSKAEIEQLLAERFPRSDMLSWVTPIPSSSAPSTAELSAPGRIELPHPAAPESHRSTAKPLSSQSFALQCTLSQRGRDKLRYAQELLGHQIPGGDIAAVIERALDALIPQLEKRKFAATSRPRRGVRRGSTNPRHIPAHVMRAVWERDQGQCTYVSDAGHRCEARKRLEFDHIVELARGGEATVEGIRLRCRAHNQYTAEHTFGAEFMRLKRIGAAEARAAARAKQPATRNAPAAPEHVEEVVPWLRALGFNTAEARRAAERCVELPDAPLEERVRFALTCFRARGARVVPASPGDAAAPPNAFRPH